MFPSRTEKIARKLTFYIFENIDIAIYNLLFFFFLSDFFFCFLSYQHFGLLFLFIIKVIWNAKSTKASNQAKKKVMKNRIK